MKELTAGNDYRSERRRLTCASLNMKIMKNSCKETLTIALPMKVEVKKT